MPYILEKCQAYRNWGFQSIYVINPMHRFVLEWGDGSLLRRDDLLSIPVERIWSALDSVLTKSEF